MDRKRAIGRLTSQKILERAGWKDECDEDEGNSKAKTNSA